LYADLGFGWAEAGSSLVFWEIGLAERLDDCGVISWMRSTAGSEIIEKKHRDPLFLQ
jgi:hypothetical protein